MVMDNSKLSVVEETRLGIYVWELPGGLYLSDDDGNLLSITSMKGDIKRMARITTVATELGFGDGFPVFVPGVRKISDMEYEDQKRRLLDGETPDEYDIGEYKDAIRRRGN